MIGFDSRLSVGGEFARKGEFSDEQIKNEPMFFNSGLAFALRKGGPITQRFIRRFLDTHPDVFMDQCVFDSRSHMLMAGWYPCIPGFHHDDVARGANGQPDYRNMAYRSQHCIGLVNAHICPTEFALGRVELTDPEAHPVVYKAWHLEVEQALREGALRSEDCPNGKLVDFDWQTFHQGTAAVADGWRWFGRISWDTERSLRCTDEIRKQVQVYLEFPMEGW